MGRHAKPEPFVRRHDRLLAALGALVVLIAVVVVVVTLRGGGDDSAATQNLPVGSPQNGISGALPGSSAPSPTPTSATPTAAAASPTPTGSGAASATASSPAPSAKSFPLLRFYVVRNTWVSVKGPGDKTVKVGTFEPGAVYTYDATVLTVRTGNAGGVRFFINGKARKVGAEGQIEEFTVRRP